MEMNDDPRFEASLRDLVAGTPLPDPTPAWKAEILDRALAPTRIPGPPRLLLTAWAIAWIAIFLLSRQPASSSRESRVATAPSRPVPQLLAQRAEFIRQLDLP